MDLRSYTLASEEIFELVCWLVCGSGCYKELEPRPCQAKKEYEHVEFGKCGDNILRQAETGYTEHEIGLLVQAVSIFPAALPTCPAVIARVMPTDNILLMKGPV